MQLRLLSAFPRPEENFNLKLCNASWQIWLNLSQLGVEETNARPEQIVLVASGRGRSLPSLSECMKAFSIALTLRKYRGSTDDEKINTRFCEAKEN